MHHLDLYPEANEHMGPAASLAARDIGMDFAGADGWRMYHGSIVPGFPQHPHRGFETVTFVRQGFVDHSDSLGATARFGRGDVQWLTAGKGIVHCEMFPLLDRERTRTRASCSRSGSTFPPPTRWSTRTSRCCGTRTSRVTSSPTTRAARTEITVIAGELAGLRPPPPPPDSWASRPEADLAIWHLVFEPGATCELPHAAAPETVRTLYVFEGGVRVGDHDLEASTGAVLRADDTVRIAGGPYGAEALVLQGRPIGEPVAQYGPFVMNDEAGIEQAFTDYRATGFGGWPWPTDDPVHPRDAGRFARHPDGRRDVPART